MEKWAAKVQLINNVACNALSPSALTQIDPEIENRKTVNHEEPPTKTEAHKWSGKKSLIRKEREKKKQTLNKHIF